MVQGQTGEVCFFAASNSSHGFQNYYPQCFGEANGVEQLYIIKGGPGTGKSYLMRKIGQRGAEVGYDVTYYYCSSDPSSLDGVICRRAGRPCIGVVDGTAPHVFEPSLPGVREEIIHLGDFWDSRVLRAQAADIRARNAQKGDRYAMAYRLLRACGEIDAVVDALITPCVYQNKIQRLAERILKEQSWGDTYCAMPALLDAVGMTGIVQLDTFEEQAQAHKQGRILYLDEDHSLGHRVMAGLLAEAQRKRLELWVAWHPVHAHKAVGLYLPATGLCVMIKEPTEGKYTCPTRHITLRHYMDTAAFRAIRGEVRQLRSLHDELMHRATWMLEQAAVHHFALEKIYSAAMDFDAKGTYEEALCHALFEL